MTKLIFGCGYLGARVAARWQAAGEEVCVVSRSPQKAQGFRAAGYRVVVADVTQPDSLRELPEAETVLFAVGYDRSGGQSIDTVYVDGMRNVLNALPAGTGRAIYISSTGVYGGAAGDWVDEQTPCQPLRAGGQACLAAENLLRSHALGSRSIILRLAGIYGPGRIPRRDALLAGELIPAPAAGYLNLIHVDDAADVVLAAETRAKPPCLYVVADGRPGQRRQYYEELARLVGAPPPQFVEPPDNSPAASRAAADRRANSAKMLAELPVQLRYPSFREGLAAIVRGETT